MMNLKRSILIIFLFCSTVFGNNDLQKVKDKIKLQEQELKTIANSKAGIAREITLLQQKLQNESRAVHLIKNQIMQNTNSLTSLQKELNLLDAKNKELTVQVRDGVAFQVENQGTLVSRIIFNDADVQNTIKMNEMVTHLNKNIAEKLKDHTEIKNNIASKQLKLTKANTELKNSIKDNEEMLKKYAETKKNLDSKFTELKKNELAKKEYIQTLKKEEERINKLIQDSIKKKNTTSSGFAKLRGKLKMPLKGKVIEKYGSKYIAEADITIMHKGIKIRPTGDGIVTIPADGKVMFVDYISGMENIVIVQHDADYYLVYANMDEFYVTAGADVKKGTHIGRINVDLKSDSSYLYLEVRQHETAIDPLPWFN